MSDMQMSYVHANVRKNKPRKQGSGFLDSTATTIVDASTSIWYGHGTLYLANQDSNKTIYSIYLTDSTANNVASNALVIDKEIPANEQDRVTVHGFGNDQTLSGRSSGNVVVATLIAEKEDQS